MLHGIAIVAAGLAILAGGEATADLADDARYEELLARHLREARVDYAALKEDPAALDAYLARVAAVPRASFDAAPAEAQVAYLVNAYNACTLRSVIEAYPIRGGWLGGANSIRGIPGVWTKRRHRIALGDLTLDQIEHEHLRARYAMPAVHMALVCASKGCPPLRAEPFRAKDLDAQLEDQARLYLASPHGLTAGGGRVAVSPIFKWFGEDFARAGGWQAWVTARAPESSRARVQDALASGAFRWISYDLSLNDTKGAP